MGDEVSTKFNALKPPEDQEAWFRLPKEPSRWFGRFQIFRDLGPGRTIEQAWRDAQQAEKRISKAKRPGKEWYAIAKEWGWQDRAQAFDFYQDIQKQNKLDSVREEMREALINRFKVYLNMNTEKLRRYINELTSGREPSISFKELERSQRMAVQIAEIFDKLVDLRIKDLPVDLQGAVEPLPMTENEWTLLVKQQSQLDAARNGASLSDSSQSEEESPESALSTSAAR